MGPAPLLLRRYTDRQLAQETALPLARSSGAVAAQGRSFAAEETGGVVLGRWESQPPARSSRK